MTFSGIYTNSGCIDRNDVLQIKVGENNGIPNNPDLPALIYPGVIAPGSSSDDVISLYAGNRWTKAWVYGVFDFHHYHYAAHEVLTVIRGQGSVQLGGEDGPCKEVTVGDVIILPAGFGHKLVDSGRDFTVVGAYPEGQNDNGFNRAGDDDARSLIAATPTPKCDPIFGAEGPLTSLWRTS